MIRSVRQSGTASSVKTLRQGAVAVELAIVLPVLLLLVIGIIESTNLIYLKQSLTVAAYEGARASIGHQATVTDINDHANLVITDRNVRGSTITISPVDFASQPYGTYIAVEVDAPYWSNSIVPGWFFRGVRLKSRIRMMKEY